MQALARQVESSSAGAAQKAAVAAAFKAYEDTWPPEEEDEQYDEDEVVGFRLRGTSFLLTYNWDFFGKYFLDGTPAAASAEDRGDEAACQLPSQDQQSCHGDASQDSREDMAGGWKTE